MSFRLNKEKSIKKERIIYKLNWEFIFEILFEIFIYVGWTFLMILIFTNPKNNKNVLFNICIISFTILLLVSWYYNYKLIKIEISNPEKDRKILVEILKNKFPEFNLIDNGADILRGKYQGGFYSSGKKLIVIFTANKILLNLVTFGRGESNIPIYSIINYLRLIKLKNEFERIKNCS